MHNLSENPHLIYALLSSHKGFEDLGTFTLARGLREIKRVQLAKEEQARKSEGNKKGAEVGEQPHEEKARLLSSENSHSRPSEEGEDGSPDRTLEGSVAEPVVSPTLESVPGSATIAMALSEKARGKMKEESRTSIDSSQEHITAAGVGRNGFVPTQEWVTSWQQG